MDQNDVSILYNINYIKVDSNFVKYAKVKTVFLKILQMKKTGFEKVPLKCLNGLAHNQTTIDVND